MTKSQLLQLKKRIDIILKRLTEEAVENGVNVASEEFEDILLKTKEKLLEERGISLEDYYKEMEEINETKRSVKKEKQEQEKEWRERVSVIKGDKGDKGEDGKDAIVDYNKIIKEALEKFQKNIS